MTTWNIQPETIGAVLTTVLGHLGDEEATEGLAGNIQDLDTAVQGAAEECSSSTPVHSAIGMFMENALPTCGDMVRRTSTAVSGCAEATEHYQLGNLEMAENAERNSLDTPVSEDEIPPNL